MTQFLMGALIAWSLCAGAASTPAFASGTENGAAAGSPSETVDTQAQDDQRDEKREQRRAERKKKKKAAGSATEQPSSGSSSQSLSP